MFSANHFLLYIYGRYHKGGVVFLGRASPQGVSGCLPNCMQVSCVIGKVLVKPTRQLKGTSQAEAVTLRWP